MKAVLITSINQKMPLLAAVRAAAIKIDPSSLIHGCDTNAECIGTYGVDKFWHCPPLEKLTVAAVIDYCHQHHIKAIIPTRDADLPFYAEHKPILAAAGLAVMVSSLTSIHYCLDKFLFCQHLQQAGFPAIPTYLTVKDMSADLYVVKERHGAGSHKLGLALTAAQACEQAHTLREPIFQPYIRGQEWSIDLYRSRDATLPRIVARSRDIVVHGESQVTTTARYPALEQLCWQMAGSLDLYGHVIFQVVIDAQDNFHVIECNPRFGGASTASLSVGLDSFYWFFLEATDHDLQATPFLRHPGDIRQIRYTTDKVIPWSSSST